MFNPRDLVSRPDNMDETVLTYLALILSRVMEQSLSNMSSVIDGGL